MYEFNTTITDEGAILLTRIIEWHEYATFKKLWFSENNYVGQEPTLTADTFGGVFATENVSASIIDNTTIKISAAIFSPAQDDTLYSIGVIMDDNGTNVLVAVCTTSDPMPISQGAGNRFAFNINLTVSSTSDITVVGTTAAVLYDTDIVDNLVTADATKVLSANMGVKIADNLAANENVLGAKNQLNDSNCMLNNMTQSGHTFTSNATDTRDFFDFEILAYEGTTYLAVLGGAPISEPKTYEFEITIPNNVNRLSIKHNGAQADIGIFVNINVTGTWVLSIDITGIDPTTVGGLSFKDIMLRPASVVDPTFVPFAETNLQLTKKTSGLSNRNLVDNGWFTVNQRGATTVTSNGNYGADRWKKTGGTSITFSSSGVTFNSGQVAQDLENQIPNGTYTASIKYSDGSIESGTVTKNNDTDILAFISRTGLTLGYIPSSHTFYMYSSGTVTVRALKLELGAVSTLHLDVEPDYTTELLKCQSEFYRDVTSGAYGYLAQVNVNSATNADFIIDLPADMGTSLSMTSSGTFQVYSGGVFHDVTLQSATQYVRGKYVGVAVCAAATMQTGWSGSLLGVSSGAYIDIQKN